MQLPLVPIIDRRDNEALGRAPGAPSSLVVSGSGWILFDGIVTLLLAYVIWRPWPSSSVWAIGTLVGINLVVSGLTRLMYSVAARKTLKAIA